MVDLKEDETRSEVLIEDVSLKNGLNHGVEMYIGTWEERGVKTRISKVAGQ